MLEILNLSKKYGNSEKYAVKHINLTIDAGEIFGFLGPNGAGKSTTIKCVTGIMPFDEGEIHVLGSSMRDKPLECKMNIGYVSDNHAVFERLTGREYVEHVANLYRVSRRARETRLEKFAEMFDMTGAFDQPIKSYSHGMKQKISVIAALVHDPALWILDEPLLGLDPQSSYLLKAAMREHAAAGNTVFFSSHILEIVENLCTKAGIIIGGELKGVYDIAKLHADGGKLEPLFMDLVGEYRR